MPSQVTVTAKIGPEKTLSSYVINPASFLTLDFEKKVATIGIPASSLQGPRTLEVDISATTTITDSVSGGNHTVVIAQ